MTENQLIEKILDTNTRKFSEKTSDKDLYPYIQYTVKKSNPEKNLDKLYMECGVYSGNTFMMIKNSLPDSITLYGFDTFTGLPEDWIDGDTNSIIYQQGTFSLNYEMNPPHGCEFVKGDVRNTLNPFLQNTKSPVQYVHFDMDLYEPTKYCLENMVSRFNSGTVLVFDDFFNLPGWRHHSFKALLEMIDSIPYEVTPLATVGWEAGWASAAFILSDKS